MALATEGLKVTKSLDEELACLIEPLTELNMRLAVSPHVNTLCLAYHYRLSRRMKGLDVNNHIKLVDWNLDPNDPGFATQLAGDKPTGWHMFYSSKDIANGLRQASAADPAQTWKSGFYNSLAVTRYRQRYVFLRKTPSNESFVKSRERLPIQEFVVELLNDGEKGSRRFIITDIVGQAKAVGRTVSLGRPPQVVYPQTLPGEAGDANADSAVFVYSSPSTAYMAQRRDDFIKIDVDGLPTHHDDAYETHVIWHVPPRTDADHNLKIRRCLSAYHEKLYAAARSSDDTALEEVGNAITLTLATRHPSFGSEIFRSSAEVKRNLLEHHSDPRHV